MSSSNMDLYELVLQYYNSGVGIDFGDVGPNCSGIKGKKMSKTCILYNIVEIIFFL